MTKKTNAIEREHFNPQMHEQVDPLLEVLAAELAYNHQAHLATRCQRLTEGDFEKLQRKLIEYGNATLTLSVDITDEKLIEKWDIYPVSLNQSTFDDVVQSFNVLPKKDEDCTITLHTGDKSVTATPDDIGNSWQGMYAVMRCNPAGE
jgi:hypothetical protein